MKKTLHVYGILLLAGLSLLISCTDKEKNNPEPIDAITYLYKLNYDTTYAVSSTGQSTAGTGNVIDSTVSVSFGNNDSLFVNGSSFAYNQEMDLYYNSARTTVSFSGTDKASISILYVNGVGHRSYRLFRGEKQ